MAEIGLGTALAAGASVLGTAVSAIGTIAAGNAQKKAAEYQAAQNEVQAADERAVAQRKAEQEGRKKRLALSRVQALSSASGLGAADPSVLDLMGELEKYGTYRQQIIQYGGESRAASLRDAATGARISGRAAQTGSYFSAAGTILGGVSDLFTKYGGGGAAMAGRYG